MLKKDITKKVVNLLIINVLTIQKLIKIITPLCHVYSIMFDL